MTVVVQSFVILLCSSGLVALGWSAGREYGRDEGYKLGRAVREASQTEH